MSTYHDLRPLVGLLAQKSLAQVTRIVHSKKDAQSSLGSNLAISASTSIRVYDKRI